MSYWSAEGDGYLEPENDHDNEPRPLDLDAFGLLVNATLRFFNLELNSLERFVFGELLVAELKNGRISEVIPFEINDELVLAQMEQARNMIAQIATDKDYELLSYRELFFITVIVSLFTPSNVNKKELLLVAAIMLANQQESDNKAQKLADEIGVKSSGFFRPNDHEITPENAGAILGKVYYEDMQLHLAEINTIMMLLEENLLPERALSILQLIVDKFYQDPTATTLDIDRINGLLGNTV